MQAFGSARRAADVEAFLENVFLGHPWPDTDLPSLAAVDARGRVIGCLGVMPRPMSLNGRPLRAAVTHNFLVDPEHRRGLVALSLMQEQGRLGIEASFCEANEEGAAVAGALGARVIAARSTRWLWPLRPSALAARFVLGDRTTTRLGATAGAICSAVDAAARLVPGSPLRLRRPAGTAEPLEPEAMADAIERLSATSALRPTYTPEALAWLLRTLASTRRDQAVRARAVRKRGEVVGWFVYYARRGGVSRVLQMGGADDARRDVLHHLLVDAFGQGSTAVSGSSDPAWDDELARGPCVVRGRKTWAMVHTTVHELPELLESPRAFFTRLEGEGWLRFAF